jgi:hypothetical protein
MRLELNTENKADMIEVLTALVRVLNTEKELPSGSLKLNEIYVGEFHPEDGT